MRKKILAFVFAAAMLVAMAVPLVGGVGTALAGVPPDSPGSTAGQVPTSVPNTSQSQAVANSTDGIAQADSVAPDDVP